MGCQKPFGWSAALATPEPSAQKLANYEYMRQGAGLREGTVKPATRNWCSSSNCSLPMVLLSITRIQFMSRNDIGNHLIAWPLARHLLKVPGAEARQRCNSVYRFTIFWWHKRLVRHNEHLHRLRPRKGWPFHPGTRYGCQVCFRSCA
jgi:hypothetical protein